MKSLFSCAFIALGVVALHFLFVQNVCAVNWNSINGRLEDDSSWQGGVKPSLTGTADFGIGTYTVSSDSGFTNGITTAGGKNANVTFDLAPNATYSMEDLSLPATTATESEPSTIVFKSGTFEVRTNKLEYLTKASGGNYNRIIITNALFKTLGQNGTAVINFAYNSKQNMLELRSGGIWHSAMGFKIGSGTNRLTIAGAGARYEHNSATDTALDLSIEGGGNTFSILDGGVFKANGKTRFIFGLSSTTGGDFIVSGSDSLFDFTSTVTDIAANTSPFILGRSGKNNTMTVADGACVSLVCSASVIGGLNGADQNRLVMTGNSLMTNSAALNVGMGSGTGADANEILIDHSTLVVNGSLAIGGKFSIDNQMILTNNAVCQIIGIGVYKCVEGGNIASGVSVLDGSSFTIENGTCQIGSGGLNGYFVVDGNSSFEAKGAGKNVIVGDYVNSIAGTNNTLLIKGGSTFTMAGDLIVGNSTAAAFNTMILNQATNSMLNTRDLYIGKHATAHFNSAYIGNQGVLKTPRNILIGGYDGSCGNQLVVSNGIVTLAGTIYVGTSTSSSTFANTHSNSVVVCGTTSKITGTALVLKNRSILEFRLDDNAAVITTPTMEFSGAVTIDDTASIKISAQKFSRAGGGTVPLFKYSSGTFDVQAVTKIIEPADLNVTFSQASGIVYAKIPSTSGTIISFF